MKDVVKDIFNAQIIIYKQGILSHTVLVIT